MSNASKALYGAAVLLAATALTPAAHADLIITLGNSNTAGTGPGPYGFVDISLLSPNHAQFTFTANSVPGFTYVFGEMGLNVNATSFSASAVTFTLAPTSNQTPSYNVTSGNLDGYGNMDIKQMPTPNGFSSAVIEAQFTVTDLSGTWANDDSVLTPDSKGFDAGAHAFANGNSFFDSNSSQCETGTTGCGGPPPPPPALPEPGTLAMFGTALASLGLMRWRQC
jgi:hypothetical protein